MLPGDLLATPVATHEVPGARAGWYPVLPGHALPRPPPCLVINIRLSPKRVSEEEFDLDKAIFPMSNSFPARQAPSQEEQWVAFLDKAWFSMSDSSCTPAAISGRAMSGWGGGIDLDKARSLHVILAPTHARDLHLTRRLRPAPTGPRPRRRNLLAPPAGALSTNVGFPVATRGGGREPRGLMGSGFTIGDNTKVIPEEQKACAHHGITELFTSRPHRPPPECRFRGIEQVTCSHRLVRIGRRPVGSANVAAAMEQ